MGNELFEKGWSDNENAKFLFLSADLVLADFNRELAGILNLVNNNFTDAGDVAAGAKRLTALVTEGVGAGAASASVTVNWDSTAVPGFVDNFVLTQLTPEGVEFTINDDPPLAKDVTAASIAALYPTGEVSFYLGRDLAETFEEGWPAPTPGLE